MLVVISLFFPWAISFANLDKLPDYGIHNHEEVQVSWYEWGRVTANGESFNPNGLTFASPHLPFGTILTLENEGRVVKARCNDRGPFKTDVNGKVVYPLEPHPTRKLDLSRGTWEALFKDKNIGVGTVRILHVEFPE